MTIKSTMTDDEIEHAWCDNYDRGVADAAATKERERIIDLLQFAAEYERRGENTSVLHIIDLIKELK